VSKNIAANLDVVVEVGGDVLRHRGEVRLLGVHARRRRGRRAARRRRRRLTLVSLRTRRVRVDSAHAAAVRQTTMAAHVGVVGEVLAADRARELVADCGGGTEATRLGAVGLQRGAAGVAARTCVAPVGVEVGAGVGAAQVHGQLRVGGEVARAERACAVRLGVLATDVLLEVAGLREAAGTQRARQPAAAVDALVTPPVRQRRKTLVALVARVRLHAYTRPSTALWLLDNSRISTMWT